MVYDNRLDFKQFVSSTLQKPSMISSLKLVIEFMLIMKSAGAGIDAGPSFIF